jgi:uncharacterized protein YkwD
VERLAHHALRGEVWDKALAYCRQAGEKAMAQSAYREAAGCFEQALSALPHLPETRDTRAQAIDLRLALRSALLPSGDLGRILAYLRETESLAAALDDPDVVKARELLEVTEPWLAELEVETKKVGDETAAGMRRVLDEAASAVGLDATADTARIEKDRKVREWNEGLTQLPPEIREQVRILNDYRAMLGLHALAIDERLCHAAAKHSAWMEQTGTFDHNVNNPGRRTPTERCEAEGYTDGVGENISFGYPSAQAVHDGWYNSAGHHRNMVLAGYHQIGVGRSGTYWTQNFGMGRPSLP